MKDESSTIPWSPPTGVRLVVYSAIVLVAYGAIGALTLSVGQLTGLASPVWPAAGLAFAVVYEWGWRLAPAVFVGSIMSNVATLARQDVLTSESIWVTVFIGVGAALQAMAGASLVARVIGRRSDLSDGRSIIGFLLLAGPVASLVNATIATAAQLGFGLLSGDQGLALWVTWWAGDAIGAVVFAPLILMFLPGQGSIWAARRIRVAVPMLIGLAVFIAFYVQTDGQLRQQRELRLEQRATDAAGELERNVARHQEALEGVSSFFESSERVNAEEFRVFTAATLERFPNLQAISWNPIVGEAELADFEAMQRDEQGFDGFVVTERNENGELIPVLSRPEYVAVQYIEPLEANAAALGFDINSNPSRAVAIERARQSGESSATAPIELVQETGTQLGMLALVPVYEVDEASGEIDRVPEKLRGFAVGVYRLGDLLTDTFVGAQWNNVDVRLVDVTDPDDSQVVAERFSITPASEDRTRAAPDYVASESFTVYGRDWQVEVLPTSGPLAAPNQGLPLAVDVFGLVMLTLLQALLLLLTGKERSAVRKAETATEEASTDSLTGLRNRRAFLRDLEQARLVSMSEESTSVLLYLDLDGFKAVNDRGGHLVGDELLEQIGRLLKDSVRGHDAVARLGGDEFAIILNQCNLDQGIVVAEKLVATVESAFVDSDAGPLSVGVSIGLTAMTPEDGFNVDELIKQADDACYEAKRGGGGIRISDVPAAHA